MKILGLDVCADTMVGDPMRRGISGGQKKRITIGEMIVGPTKTLFMDEISTGLHSLCPSRSTSGLAFVYCLFLLVSVVSCMSSEDRDILNPEMFSIGTGLACELAKCLRGQCVNTSSLPFYKCQCNAGWKSPFGASWLPCIMPNCSIDLSCNNSSNQNSAPPPVVPPFGGVFDICSLHVCGNGRCIGNDTAGNSSDNYTCDCDPGYLNFMNKSDGYCIHKCSIGADCTNVNLPLGGGVHPPPPPLLQPPPVSPSQSGSNQGQAMKLPNNILMAATSLAALVLA